MSIELALSFPDWSQQTTFSNYSILFWWMADKWHLQWSQTQFDCWRKRCTNWMVQMGFVSASSTLHKLKKFFILVLYTFFQNEHVLSYFTALVLGASCSYLHQSTQ